MIRNLLSIPRPALALVACASVASAQSLNVDLFGNSPTTIPSPAFGAAAAQPGVWNGLDCSFCDSQAFPLVGLLGQPTGAVLTMQQGGFGESCTDATLTSDEAALVRSGQAGFDQFTAVRLSITGLQPGEYDLWVYAGKRCTNIVAPVLCDLSIGSTHQVQRESGDPWNVSLFELDANCMRFRIQLLAGQGFGLNLVAAIPEWFSAQGLQLVQLSPRILPLCFGANDGFGCPCGPGAFGAGCPSSFEPQGARLDGLGTPSVTSDSVLLSASGVGFSPVLFFQGTTLPAQGAGTVFGDGLLCASGVSLRLAILQSDFGVVAYPPPGDTPLSIRGLIPPTGGRRYYQVIYRDSAPFCTPSGFNLTNGVLVSWAP